MQVTAELKRKHLLGVEDKLVTAQCGTVPTESTPSILKNYISRKAHHPQQ
jgi:hypothetical protein